MPPGGLPRFIEKGRSLRHIWLNGLNDTIGNGFTVTVTEAVLVQPRVVPVRV